MKKQQITFSSMWRRSQGNLTFFMNFILFCIICNISRKLVQTQFWSEKGDTNYLEFWIFNFFSGWFSNSAKSRIKLNLDRSRSIHWSSFKQLKTVWSYETINAASCQYSNSLRAAVMNFNRAALKRLH